MSLESSVYDALKTLVANRVLPDVAPTNTDRPYIVYQQVGGEAINFLESVPPGKRNARVQVSCWAATRIAAAALARQAEDALISNTTVRAYVLGALISTYVEDLELYGTSQDFSIWH